MQNQLQRLSELSEGIKFLEDRLKVQRQKRDRLALSLMESGKYSWRLIAKHAGFANTYLAILKRKSSKEITNGK